MLPDFRVWEKEEFINWLSKRNADYLYSK